MEAVRADFELLFNNALEYNMKDSIIWVDATDMLVSRVRSIPRPHSHLMSRNSSRKHMINLPLLSNMVVILTMTRRRANPKHLILTDLSSRDSRNWSRKPTKGIFIHPSYSWKLLRCCIPVVVLCQQNSCSSQTKSSGRFITNR